MSQQLYVWLFVVKKSLKNHIRPVYYCCLYRERWNKKISCIGKRFNFDKEKPIAQLSKNSKSFWSWIFICPLDFFYIHFQFWLTYKFRGSLSKSKEKNELNSNFTILLNPLGNMSDFFAHQFSRKWLIRTSHKSGNQISMAQYYYGQYTMRSI